ncbi:hypothetical protein GE061_008390 [Apolygus lucorum]|uniref:Uncharacterized protein n=1 Tax=Apolygus lucorum TaxID=248454 RepID=A0A6A4IY52_APOLU|nr:hypothetical protein GE061_008390 [Apolygus lucorum]
MKLPEIKILLDKLLDKGRALACDEVTTFFGKQHAAPFQGSLWVRCHRTGNKMGRGGLPAKGVRGYGKVNMGINTQFPWKMPGREVEEGIMVGEVPMEVAACKQVIGKRLEAGVDTVVSTNSTSRWTLAQMSLTTVL